MKTNKISYSLGITPKFMVVFLLFNGILFSCNNSEKKQDAVNIDHPIVGKWIKVGHAGNTSFNFKKNGLVEGDFGNDKSIDVVAEYEIKNDTIKFVDKKGQACEGYGLYKIDQTDNYVSFDLIEDNCAGRIKTTLGFWVRPNFEDTLSKLNTQIENSSQLELLLNRGRVFLAIGKSVQAKQDFDSFISQDSTNARVYINRAGTRFPHDMKGAVLDCNKSIELNPKNKNAYFLRGLAKYELGEKEQACEDFEKAIELGFSILRIAEQKRCENFWVKTE
ncbi:tetratricopeptide repeat protein [Seonamhaeicola maritimus]|uniref:Tetratricopeptide repeat protein n=1 Tax=Seonamhaeicola maritimus TaxID=2591822 RepID=A0A5C7GEE3_9FLAO|nr:tetratricopeptide repeat protein [Seonamhaeicola maritimus]TXG35242.1 tetratricopeptide repeat protein [Seonamhaeicola maritimus]